MENKLKKLIDQSMRILITSHISPDPDAVASVLLTGLTLEANFSDKNVKMALEEQPDGLDFLPGYDRLEFGPQSQAINNFKPDLVIMVDVGNVERITRGGAENIQSYFVSLGAKLAIIDHHVPDGHDKADLYIGSNEPSAASEIYNILFNQIGLKQPDAAAELTLTGIYADTGGFLYIDKTNRDVLKLVDKLIEAGASVEETKYKLSRLTQDQMEVISELADNVSNTSGYTYSFIGDDFIRGWVNDGKDFGALQRANKSFIDNYLRVVDGRLMGFVFYKNPLEADNTYSVSFRSVRYAQDVEKIAKKLNGGGHKSAAGGKVIANDSLEALEKIKQAL